MANTVLFLASVVMVLYIVHLAECAITRKKMYTRLIEAEQLLCEKLDNMTELIKSLDDCPTPGTCPPKCQPDEVCIDLDTVGKIQGTIPGFSIISAQTPLIPGKPCSRQAVFKVHFAKNLLAPDDNICIQSKTSPQIALPFQRMLKIQMYFSNGERSGYMFNIGDSQSNNGYGGDSSHQNYDAEVQGVGKSVAVYPNDKCGSTPSIFSYANAINHPVSLLNAWIKDKYLKVSNDNGLVDANCSPCLYGLPGVNDTEGPLNEDIYVAGNRVVGHASRSGVGLCFMKMRWVTSPNE